MQKKTAMGIRQKILTGFIILGSLLIISGVISIYELTKLGNSVNQLLDDNYKSIDYSKRMSLSLEQQKKALILSVNGNKDDAGALLKQSAKTFKTYLTRTSQNLTLPEEVRLLDSLKLSYSRFNALTEQFVFSEHSTLSSYIDTILPAAYCVQRYLEEILTVNQQKLNETANVLKNSPYRTILPGLIVIITSIVFSIIFNYMITYYMVKPIIRITDSINHFVKFKRPFEVTVETKDEIYRLREAVKNLITTKTLTKK